MRWTGATLATRLIFFSLLSFFFLLKREFKEMEVSRVFRWLGKFDIFFKNSSEVLGQ